MSGPVQKTVAMRVLDLTIAVPDALAKDLDGFDRTDTPADLQVTVSSLPEALAELTRLAVTHSNLLCMHAGVVSGPRGLIAIPGRSGLGKTTLVAALVRAGFGYVSDETLAINRDTGHVTPFPRPLGLGADVWPVLDLPGDPPPPGRERCLPATYFGAVDKAGGVVADLVLARRAPGECRLEPARRGDAVGELLTRSFNHYRNAEASFHAVVELVRHARVLRAEYDEAPVLAQLLAASLNADQPDAATIRR